MKKPSVSMLTDGTKRMDRWLQEYQGLDGTVRQWDGKAVQCYMRSRVSALEVTAIFGKEGVLVGQSRAAVVRRRDVRNTTGRSKISPMWIASTIAGN